MLFVTFTDIPLCPIQIIWNLGKRLWKSKQALFLQIQCILARHKERVLNLRNHTRVMCAAALCLFSWFVLVLLSLCLGAHVGNAESNVEPVFCLYPIPLLFYLFPLYSAFKTNDKKRKCLTRVGRCLYFSLLCCNIFCALQTSLPGMQPAERDYFIFFHRMADVIFLTLIPSLCLTAILHNRKKIRQKSSSFIKRICAKQPEGTFCTWKDWIFRERRLVCASHFPRSLAIRRKAIGNGEIREVILEFGRVLIIIMSAVVCVRVCYNVSHL